MPFSPGHLIQKKKKKKKKGESTWGLVGEHNLMNNVAPLGEGTRAIWGGDGKSSSTPGRNKSAGKNHSRKLNAPFPGRSPEGSKKKRPQKTVPNNPNCFTLKKHSVTLDRSVCGRENPSMREKKKDQGRRLGRNTLKKNRKKKHQPLEPGGKRPSSDADQPTTKKKKRRRRNNEKEHRIPLL